MSKLILYFYYYSNKNKLIMGNKFHCYYCGEGRDLIKVDDRHYHEECYNLCNTCIECGITSLKSDLTVYRMKYYCLLCFKRKTNVFRLSGDLTISDYQI